MIKIQEIIPIKVSGLTSLKIEFDYNEDIITALKNLEFYVYHKRLKFWEVPINELAEVIDSLTYLDDITLSLLESNSNTVSTDLTDFEISQFKYAPYKHQIEGINFGLSHPKFLLLDEPGSGKTMMAICLAETLKRRGLIDHCLIICGVDSLRQNWKKEILKFSKESCLVLGEKISKTGTVSYESVSKRAEQLKKPIDAFFVIVNIATLRDKLIIEAFKKSENTFGLLVVDEIHRCNNASSQQGENLKLLTAPYKTGMSGSPLTNSPVSLYLPLSWIEVDHATQTNFKGQYCVFGGFGHAQVIGHKNLDLLREELDSCSIRRLKSQMTDLPSKTITYELIEMSTEHKKFYEAIKQGVKEEANKITLKAGNLLALTTRLRQATACPSILTTQNIQSSKLERCVEIVEELIEQNEKVVIMSTFKEPVYQLSKLLEKHKPLLCTGDQSETVIEYNKDLFQNNPDYKLFIGTAAKGGTGITLNAAAYMIMLDTPWTYSEFDQICNRIDRINNTRPAFITVLQCKDTIDERVARIVESKKGLSDFVVDNIESESILNDMRNILLDL